jgi:dienelactone hydrolase
MSQQPSDERGPITAEYDPFARGPFPVAVRTFDALDEARDRRFPCEVWYPTAARPETHPLILFSHGSARGARRMASALCTHLASHGYAVAALDHSEVVAPELAPRAGESPEEKAARVEALIGSRVPDLRFLLDHLLGTPWPEASLDASRVGAVGYSLGGWTVLAAAEVETRIRAVVALAPAGSSQPRPGIAPVKLAFDWGRDVPTLYLVAENDTMTPLSGEQELFERTPATKRMVVLRRADHLHFLDAVEEEHELVRTMPWPAELAWIPKEMRPISELSSGEAARRFVRGLTLCHFDAFLRSRDEARALLAGGLEGELAAQGVEARVHEGPGA